MADQPTQRRSRTPGPPAPDGQKPPGQRAPGGAPPARQLPRMPGSRMFWIVVLVALTLNYVLVALFASGKERSVKIPYSPTFLEQVDKGNVKRINTQGATAQGEFKNPIKYPSDKAQPAKNFDTEIPSFVITSAGNQLEDRLIEHKVELSATPINEGRGFLYNLILGFGPVILLVGLFVWISRRAAGGQMSALGAFGRSRARRGGGSGTRAAVKGGAGGGGAK